MPLERIVSPPPGPRSIPEQRDLGRFHLVGAFLATLPGLSRVLPPLIGALIAGALAIGVLGAFKPPAAALFTLAAPNLYVPQFSWAAMVELVVPLAITVLAVQNAQGVAILATNGHQGPVNAITVACGAGSVVTGLFGAVSTCPTGPVSAVLSSAGETHRQYTGALFFCLLAVAFGGADLLSGYRGRRTDPANRRAVLGVGVRACGLLAPRAGGRAG